MQSVDYEKAKKAFDEYDVDGDGMISLDGIFKNHQNLNDFKIGQIFLFWNFIKSI